MILSPHSIESLVSKVLPLDALLSEARTHGVKVFLGGGALRDLGLSHSDAADLDLLVEGPPEKTAAFIALARSSLVPKEKSGAPPLDFSPCKSARHFVHQYDFSVNSILFDLDSKEISCPTTGIQDLERRLLRMNSPTFFVTSYRSFVRVFRLAASRHMTIDPEVEKCIRQFHPMIAYSSAVVRTKVYLDLIALFCERDLVEAVGKLVDVEVLFTLFPHLLIERERHRARESWEMRTFVEVQNKVEALAHDQKSLLRKTTTALLELDGNSYRLQYSGQALLCLAVLIAEIGRSMQRLDPNLPPPFTKPEYAVNGRRSLVRDLLLSLAPLQPLRELLQHALVLNEFSEGVARPALNPELGAIAAFYEGIKKSGPHA